MPALMTISQPTPGASPADSSKRDGVDDEVVTVTLDESGTLEFMAVPPGVTTPAFTGGPTVYTFTPAVGVTGHKYILRSTATSDGTFSRRTFGIPDPFTGLIMPAWNEIGDPDGYDGVKADAAVIDASDDNAIDSVYTTGNPTAWARDLHEMGAVVNNLGGAGFAHFKLTDNPPSPRPPNVFDNVPALVAVLNATPGPKLIILDGEDFFCSEDLDLDGCFFQCVDGEDIYLDQDCVLINLDRLASFGWANGVFSQDADAAPFALGTNHDLLIKCTGYCEYNTENGNSLFTLESGRVHLDGPSAQFVIDGAIVEGTAGTGTPRVEVRAEYLELASGMDEFMFNDNGAAGQFDLWISGLDIDGSAGPVGEGISAHAIAASGWTLGQIVRHGAGPSTKTLVDSDAPLVDNGDMGRTIIIDQGATWILPPFTGGDDGMGEILVVAHEDCAPGSSREAAIDFDGQTVHYGRNDTMTQWVLNSSGQTVRLRPTASGEWTVVGVYEPGVVYLKGFADGENTTATWEAVGPMFYLDPDEAGASLLIWDNPDTDDGRVRLGISSGSGTAQLRLYEVGVGAVTNEWENTGAVGDEFPAANLTITDAGWYQFELREADATGTARLDGVDIRFIPVTGGF